MKLLSSPFVSSDLSSERSFAVYQFTCKEMVISRYRDIFTPLETLSENSLFLSSERASHSWKLRGIVNISCNEIGKHPCNKTSLTRAS